MKTTNAVIFWNVLIFLTLVLSIIFFPRYFGVEDYILSYGLFVIVLTTGYFIFCLTAGIIASISNKKDIANGFYISAMTIVMLCIPSCYGGIFMRSIVLQ